MMRALLNSFEVQRKQIDMQPVSIVENTVVQIDYDCHVNAGSRPGILLSSSTTRVNWSFWVGDEVDVASMRKLKMVSG